MSIKTLVFQPSYFRVNVVLTTKTCANQASCFHYTIIFDFVSGIEIYLDRKRCLHELDYGIDFSPENLKIHPVAALMPLFVLYVSLDRRTGDIKYGHKR